MIKSDILKIKRIENFDNNYIEREMSKHFSAIIRWAIVEITETEIIVSISYQV